MGRSWFGFLAILFVITGCSSDYTFSTNLDRENFRDYFAPSRIKVYQSISPPAQFKSLGKIVGESCKRQDNDVPPTIDAARIDAQRQASRIGANALIIEHCSTIKGKEAKPCVEVVRCSGQAIQDETIDD